MPSCFTRPILAPLLLALLCVTAIARDGLASIPEHSPRLFQEQPAAGKFLIASESMRDPRFRESVILLLNHDAQGTLGLIINRPTRIPLSEVVDGDPPGQLFFGGPVQPTVFSLLVNGEPGDDAADNGRSFVLDSVWFVFGTEAVLDRLTALEAGAAARVYAGYAGWSPGQLNAELRDGGWHLSAATADAIFAEDPARIWDTLIRRVRGRWI
jgi:putative transcriptional regulator